MLIMKVQSNAEEDSFGKKNDKFKKEMHNWLSNIITCKWSVRHSEMAKHAYTQLQIRRVLLITLNNYFLFFYFFEDFIIIN